MQSLTDEIKSRLRIGDLLNKLGLELERNGCVQAPGRQQKSGSVHIYFETDTFMDYSCDRGGSVIDLYAYYQNVDDSTAIKELAQLCGIIEGRTERLPDRPAQEARQYVRQKFTDALTNDERVYYGSFFKTAVQTDPAIITKAETAVKRSRMYSNAEVFAEMERYCNEKGWGDLAWRYITEKRKLPEAVVKAFRLFFISNYYELNNHLKKEFGLERLQKSGLYNDRGNLIFYSHRIIIPYIWEREIIYMRGRYYDEKGNLNGDNKYLGLRSDATRVNTPKRFFNLEEINGMKDGEHLYVTEGEFDAMAIKSLGFHAVAVPGSGNIPDTPKLKPLLPFTIVVCGDRDEAGEGLRDKLITAFQYWRKDIKEKELPLDVKDANDFLTA
jgi:DNA primase